MWIKIVKMCVSGTVVSAQDATEEEEAVDEDAADDAMPEDEDDEAEVEDDDNTELVRELTKVKLLSSDTISR